MPELAGQASSGFTKIPDVVLDRPGPGEAFNPWDFFGLRYR